jgi:hypothetical protein
MSKAHTQRALRIMADHSAYGSNIMVSESEKTSAFLIPLKTGRLPGDLRTSVCFSIRAKV